MGLLRDDLKKAISKFDKSGKRKPRGKDPRKANVGSGSANRAKEAVGGRRRQLDKAIEDSGG